MPRKEYVKTLINGENLEFLCEPRQSLLECLRDVLGLTGTKEGCNDGNCGACTVMLDGRMVNYCLVLGVEARGREIGTVEGIATPAGPAPDPTGVPGKCGATVRLLHARVYRRLQGALGDRALPIGGAYSQMAGREPLSVHGLRQDRQSGARRGGYVGHRILARYLAGCDGSGSLQSALAVTIGTGSLSVRNARQSGGIE